MQHGGPEHGGPEHGDAQHTDPEHGHTKVFSYPLTVVMFDATSWFEMQCGRTRVDECCVERDVVRAMQHGGAEHGDAQHGGAEHGDAEHTDPEHGHTKVCHIP